MTEDQWLRFRDLLRLLAHLRRGPKVSRTRGGRRKLRLFACACCRSMLWEMRVGKAFRQLVDLAEKHADGLVGRAALDKARQQRRNRPAPTWGKLWFAAEAMEYTLHETPVTAARDAADYALSAVSFTRHVLRAAIRPSDAKERAAVRQRQCDLLRDIFGNPFRPVALDPAWRSSTVAALAEAIYADRAFDRLPILADALEDAGCTSAEVLEHCRQPGEHARGCWVVDLVLGKS